MTTEPYVPNLATAESAYVHWALLSDRGIDAADASDEFDRFLAKIKADVWAEGYGAGFLDDLLTRQPQPNPYRDQGGRQ
ncbi:hypothetical protein ACU4IU_00385 [Brevibacterium sp. CSND-B09]|uniref:hypothetical protein n=1 Tax=Brevibacterium sp. CSND-B09 TaxID=3462571 RepID=UPI00406A5F28